MGMLKTPAPIPQVPPKIPPNTPDIPAPMALLIVRVIDRGKKSRSPFFCHVHEYGTQGYH